MKMNLNSGAIFSMVTVTLLLCCLSSFVLAQKTISTVPEIPRSTKEHLVCYYDSSSFVKEGLGKLVIDDLEPALHFCTYLIYGYAGLERDSFKAISLNQNLDLDLGKGLYRTVTRLKRKYPGLKVLLSFGGDKDIDLTDDGKELPNKYLEVLENPTGRMRFVATAYALAKTYGFDGLDIAWQFPKNKPKKVHSGLGSLWKGFKKVFSGDHVIDENAEQHKEQFTALLRELKTELRTDNMLLSATVLPNVNSSLFYDVPSVLNYVDFVNLMAFDYQTPERNPDMADLPAPIYALTERNEQFNVDYQVQFWLRSGCPPSKLNVGVPTHARPWKLTDFGSKGAVPPLTDVSNEAPLGPDTETLGRYSWTEVCAMLPNTHNSHLKGANAPLTKVTDPQHHSGVYAYRAPDKKGNNGIWVSYEDPDTAAEKAAYVKKNHLGGVALFDLAHDDFRGSCTGDQYPILRAIKYRLSN